MDEYVAQSTLAEQLLYILMSAWGGSITLGRMPRPSFRFVAWVCYRSVFVGLIAGNFLKGAGYSLRWAFVGAAAAGFLYEWLLLGAAELGGRYASRPIRTMRMIRGLPVSRDDEKEPDKEVSDGN